MATDAGPTPARPTIDSLLAQRDARRMGAPGDPAVAEARRDLSVFLWRSYRAFNALRRHLDDQRPRDPAKRGRRPFVSRSDRQAALVARLMDEGYITGGNGVYRLSDDPDSQTYLSGGWLEELGFLAARSGGAEEVYFAQAIEWRVGGHTGFNEIDVIARRGGVLSFISCKTADPVYNPRNGHLREKFRHFMLEADYWDQHFAGGTGRAVLLVSTDLYDEARGTWRCPTLAARATVLDTDLIGTDHDSWDALVAALRRHWEPDPDA